MIYDLLPKYIKVVMGNYDPKCDKTFADISFLVQHEIDLYREGEESCCNKESQAIRLQSWVDKHKRFV